MHTFKGKKVQESIQRGKTPHTCCNRRTSSCFSCRTSSASLCSTSSCCLRSATFLMCCRTRHTQLRGDTTETLSCVLPVATKPNQGLYFMSSLHSVRNSHWKADCNAVTENSQISDGHLISHPNPWSSLSKALLFKILQKQNSHWKHRDKRTVKKGKQPTNAIQRQQCLDSPSSHVDPTDLQHLL